MEQVAYFFDKKKEYQSLSNFWVCDVVIDNKRVYESGEHCFHGEKYLFISQFCENDEKKQQLIVYSKTFLKPSLYKSAKEAKRMGGKKGLFLNAKEMEFWNYQSIKVQEQICIWKLDNNEIVKTDLIKSERKLLIHPALRCSEMLIEKKTIWEGRAIMRDGRLIVIGRNQLGNIWMKLRNNFTVM